MLMNAVAKGDHGAAQSHASTCLSYLARVIMRASLLALMIQYLTRSYTLQLLEKLLKGDTADYTAWRDDLQAAHTKLRNALEAAYPDSTSAAPPLPNGLLVATSLNLSPGQRTINGLYFPKEHEDYVLKKLAAMQADAMSSKP